MSELTASNGSLEKEAAADVERCGGRTGPSFQAGLDTVFKFIGCKKGQRFRA